jgi:hypothetical protein
MTSSDRRLRKFGPLRQAAPIVGAVEERLHRETELVAGGVHPAEDQEHQRDAQLVVIQPILFVLGLNEPGDEVILRLATTVGDQLVGEPIEALECRLDSR